MAPDEAVFCVVESELLLPPQPPIESRTATANRARSLVTDGSLLELPLRAEAVAQTLGDAAESLLRVGSEKLHLVSQR
jgi:hypothetical protein